MQSDRSGQLVSASQARDDVSHHYSLLNAIKQRGNHEQTKKEQQKWVGVGKDGGLIALKADKQAYVNNGTHTEQKYSHTYFFFGLCNH